jgi:hypothetical protein
LDAEAKIRLAEGERAEAAAAGLADVEVRERGAEAISRVGRAEAEATAARLKAEAEGARLLSLATAEGAAAQAKADAEGVRARALAAAEGTAAQAGAEAAMVGEKLKAEAAGLKEKAAAMAALDEASRGHEEYRLRLAAEKDIRLAGLDAQRQIAQAQASVLAAGLEKADISVVGGDSVFFDRLVGAVSAGRGLDTFLSSSQTARALAAPWLDGSADFTDDATRVLSALGANTSGANLAGVLARALAGTGAAAAPDAQSGALVKAAAGETASAAAPGPVNSAAAANATVKR